MLLFIGNLVPVKGPDLLLAAWSILQRTDHRPPTTDHLILLGSGPMLPHLQRQAAKLGIDDRVAFLGSRPHAEVALWMNAADVLCVPSRSEGMPNVVLEALAAGLPTVAADAGDCRRVLAQEPAARVVPREDPAALGRGLLELLVAGCDREALARRHGAQLSWDACAGRHLERMENVPARG